MAGNGDGKGKNLANAAAFLSKIRRPVVGRFESNIGPETDLRPIFPRVVDHQLLPQGNRMPSVVSDFSWSFSESSRVSK